MSNRKWTREQSILALYLYRQIPMGQIHSRNKQIEEISKLIGRTPAALAMKMCNFAHLDPIMQRQGIIGLSNGSRLDKEIWQEFSSNYYKLANEAMNFLSLIKKDEQKD